MFRFTIRDVLWLTVAVALGGGWWRDHAAILAIDKWWVGHVEQEHGSIPTTTSD